MRLYHPYRGWGYLLTWEGLNVLVMFDGDTIPTWCEQHWLSLEKEGVKFGRGW